METSERLAAIEAKIDRVINGLNISLEQIEEILARITDVMDEKYPGAPQ